MTEYYNVVFNDDSKSKIKSSEENFNIIFQEQGSLKAIFSEQDIFKVDQLENNVLNANFGEVTEILADTTIATTTTLGLVKVGENLSITKDGLLSVDTTNNAEEDNTKPMTSAGVYTQLGNINVLLEKI